MKIARQRHLLASIALSALLVGACTATHHVIPASVVEITKTDHPTVFIGEGRLSHAPQYLELSVTVHSECYPTPLEASLATDEAATNVMNLLRGAIDRDNPKDGVFSSGGYTQPFSRYVRQDVTVCKGTYQKTSTIVMKSSRVAEFPTEYAEIQRVVFSGSLRQVGDDRSEKPVTFASLGEPVPQLYYETRERLEQQALANALANAQLKFSATSKVACEDTSHRILKFVEQSVGGGRPIAYGRSQPSDEGDGSAVELDAIWINKLLEVYFIIEPGACKT